MSSASIRGVLGMWATLVLLGCSSSRVDPGWASPGEADAAQVMAILGEMMPQRSRQVHRVLLRGAGRETLLTGHLELDRSEGFRAVAVDELGGPAFAFLSCRTRSEIVESPPGVDRQLLMRGPVADLSAAFMLPDTTPDAVGPSGPGVRALWRRGGTQLQCSFDLSARRVLSCEESSRGRALRRLSYRYGEPGRSGGVTAILVTDRALHFSMEIELLELAPLSPAATDRDWCDPDS